jgi:hypothetical protein
MAVVVVAVVVNFEENREHENKVRNANHDVVEISNRI